MMNIQNRSKLIKNSENLKGFKFIGILIKSFNILFSLKSIYLIIFIWNYYK